MKFSTRAEYGLRAMVNLAENNGRLKSLRKIAREESVSIKYLERLFNILRKNNLVESQKGANGGYALKAAPDQINVADIIVALEGPIAPMKCIGKSCTMEYSCRSKIVWEKVGAQIEKTLQNIKLNDLIK